MAGERAISPSETDMCHVPCFEDAAYECKLSELIASLAVKNGHVVMQDHGVPANRSIELVMFVGNYI